MPSEDVYLAYDLLGGKRGPLRTIARATGYVVLFFIGYVLRLGLAAGTVNALVFLFSPALERWIENLPERRLGVAGLGLIFEE
jgi:hypothetical protein